MGCPSVQVSWHHSSHCMQAIQSSTIGVRNSSLLQIQNQLVIFFFAGCLPFFDTSEDFNIPAPNDTAYKRWSCHSGLKLLCKLCRTFPPRFTVFWACRPCGPAGWLAMLLVKAGDVETNPGLNKQVWICDICQKQIHVRKQISIRCNRIEHWVHLKCAGIRQAQYTDTWT